MWKRCTKASRCRACGKPDWCTFTQDCVMCMRTNEPPAGMRFVRTLDNGGNLFKDEPDATFKVQGRTG